jgi:hypothetical protein
MPPEDARAIMAKLVAFVKVRLGPCLCAKRIVKRLPIGQRLPGGAAGTLPMLALVHRSLVWTRG